jgi:hypothetical protein
MPTNPILEEIYAARDQLLAECHGDVHAYIEEARKRALASGRPIATPKQRTKPPCGPTNESIGADNSVTASR